MTDSKNFNAVDLNQAIIDHTEQALMDTTKVDHFIVVQQNLNARYKQPEPDKLEKILSNLTKNNRTLTYDREQSIKTTDLKKVYVLLKIRKDSGVQTVFKIIINKERALKKQLEHWLYMLDSDFCSEYENYIENWSILIKKLKLPQNIIREPDVPKLMLRLRKPGKTDSDSDSDLDSNKEGHTEYLMDFSRWPEYVRQLSIEKVKDYLATLSTHYYTDRIDIVKMQLE